MDELSFPLNDFLQVNSFHLFGSVLQNSFANPTDPLSTPLNTHLDYFNVGWGGVRSSNLPYPLEPNSAGDLNYENPDNTSILPVCKWGTPNQPETDKDIHTGKGYTTFVDNRFLLDQNIPPVLPWCRRKTCPDDPNDQKTWNSQVDKTNNCTANPSNSECSCMVRLCMCSYRQITLIPCKS